MLLHVIPPAAPPRDTETMLTWSRSTLAEDTADFGLEKVVLCGDPVPTISEYAQQIDAGLILMPTTRSVWSCADPLPRGYSHRRRGPFIIGRPPTMRLRSVAGNCCVFWSWTAATVH